MNILLLGGTGYIGSFLEKFLSTNNHKVLSIGRSTEKKFEVGKFLDESIFNNIDMVFFLAWEFNTRLKNYEKLNISSFDKVAKFCKNNRIKLIFFSTLFASANNKSLYNSTKAMCEKIALDNEFPVVRLGSVVLNEKNVQKDSFYEKINIFINKYKIFPIIYPNKKIFRKTTEEELKRFSLDFAYFEDEIHVIANKEEQTLKELLEIPPKRFLYIPVHWKMLHIFFRFIEIFNKNFQFRSDSIISVWSS